uniref:GTF3C1 extended winged-helix domain-containing protein n=1 Tax=Meloidogyne floridensis TaxID=298350 RepID=A0A915P129_9BILA
MNLIHVESINESADIPLEFSNNLDETGQSREQEKSAYLPYDPEKFSLAHFYRPQNDVVASWIVQAGMEGIDRYEISSRLGIDADTKPGNRLVSTSIHSTVRNREKYFGEFQKTEGRFRVKKYFFKCAQNEAGGELYVKYSQRFKKLTGVDCPFRFGDLLKFPGYNLNTLRITDITLKRLIQILEYLKDVKAVLTNIRLQTYITFLEQNEGYQFSIDRKSIKKLLLALLQKKFINILKLEVLENGIAQTIDVITIPEITSIGDVHVSEVLEKTMNEFKEQNKSFPSGHQLKRERPAVEPKVVLQVEEDSPLKKEQSHDVVMIEEQEQTSSTPPISGSLLHKTFSTVERLQAYHKYGKKGANPYSILSSKTINNLVESAKQRRISKIVHKRNPKKSVKIEIPKDVEETGSTSVDDSSSPTKSIQSKTEPTKRHYSQNARLMDNVDRISLQHKSYLRSRFSQRERDMLLLIRASSFFLNPVSKFWPHPKVMRNLMHEFVPESRTKTTYSLMAAGVRELKDRQDQHQYIVKTLASFKDLLNLRNRLVVMNLSKEPIKEGDDLKPKDLFFIDAFRTAYKLLFRESDDCPSIYASDQEFRNHLNKNKLHFIQVASDDKTAYAPTRSHPPKSAEEIRERVAFNAVMSALLSENGTEKTFEGQKTQIEPSTSDTGGNYLSSGGVEFTNFLLQQIEPSILSNTIENIRSDGLITKNRIFGSKTTGTDDKQSKDLAESGVEQSPQKSGDTQETSYSARKSVRLTQFYHHYFESTLHTNLKKNILDTTTKFIENKPNKKNDFGEFENPGEFIILANLACDSRPLNIDMTIPESFDALFKLNKSSDGPSTSNTVKEEETHFKINATKQLRYLEDSELCIERLKIRPTTLNESILSTIRGMPQFEDLLPFEKFIPAEKMDLIENSESNVTEELDKNFSKETQKLYKLIDKSGILGISEEELKASINLQNLDEFNINLNLLIKETLIFPSGVVKRFFVSTRNGRAWLLKTKEGNGFVAKPWLLPSGEINWNVLRRVLEGIFWHIYANPGISIDDLTSRFVYVLQPVLLHGLVEMLEKLGCCKIITKTLHSQRKSSPFSDAKTPQKIQFVQPSSNGMERLVLFKNGISSE